MCDKIITIKSTVWRRLINRYSKWKETGDRQYVQKHWTREPLDRRCSRLVKEISPKYNYDVYWNWNWNHYYYFIYTFILFSTHSLSECYFRYLTVLALSSKRVSQFVYLHSVSIHWLQNQLQCFVTGVRL